MPVPAGAGASDRMAAALPPVPRSRRRGGESLPACQWLLSQSQSRCHGRGPSRVGLRVVTVTRTPAGGGLESGTARDLEAPAGSRAKSCESQADSDSEADHDH